MLQLANVKFSKQDILEIKLLLQKLGDTFRRENVKKYATKELYEKLEKVCETVCWPYHALLNVIVTKKPPTCFCSKKELITKYDSNKHRFPVCNHGPKCTENATRIQKLKVATMVKNTFGEKNE